MNITRFAPSPTGRLHLGHAYSAALGHAGARESGGKFRLRIEDLDPTRCRPEFVDVIYEDLSWLGLDWDEPVLDQSQRTERLVQVMTRHDQKVVRAHHHRQLQLDRTALRTREPTQYLQKLQSPKQQLRELLKRHQNSLLQQRSRNLLPIQNQYRSL